MILMTAYMILVGCLMSKRDKYTRSAKGQDCTVRIPGVCRPAPENETTVFAHLNGGGLGAKHLSVHGAYSCAQCHDVIDGRSRNRGHTNKEVKMMHLEAVIRTQIIMVRDGILKL